MTFSGDRHLDILSSALMIETLILDILSVTGTLTFFGETDCI